MRRAPPVRAARPRRWSAHPASSRLKLRSGTPVKHRRDRLNSNGPADASTSRRAHRAMPVAQAAGPCATTHSNATWASSRLAGPVSPGANRTIAAQASGLGACCATTCHCCERLCRPARPFGALRPPRPPREAPSAPPHSPPARSGTPAPPAHSPHTPCTRAHRPPAHRGEVFFADPHLVFLFLSETGCLQNQSS